LFFLFINESVFGRVGKGIKRREIKYGRRSGSLRCVVDENAVAAEEAALRPQSNRWNNRDDETPLGCAPRAPGGATCIASGAITDSATLPRQSAVTTSRIVVFGRLQLRYYWAFAADFRLHYYFASTRPRPLGPSILYNVCVSMTAGGRAPG